MAIALDLDAKEMEEEARIRLAQEGQLNLATDQDEESIRLMKQALLLEKIIANCQENQDDFYPSIKADQRPLIGAAVAPALGSSDPSPSNYI